MNTLVFVLMVYTHSGYYIPTLEFSEASKCEEAVEVFYKSAVEHRHPLSFANDKRGYCVAIRK